MPRIDGTDLLSQDAMALLDQGKPLAALVALGLTLDQAKKLSRLRGLQSAAAPHLPTTALAKLHSLGLKLVALASVIHAQDWPGLEEILQSVDTATVKREDLEQAPTLLAEKRMRVAEAETQMRTRLEYLERQQEQLRQERIDLKKLERQLEKSLLFLAPYPEPVRDFLAEHLGVDEDGRLVLAQRLDYPWQTSLKEKGAVHYDEDGMVWLVDNLDYLATATERRLKNGNPVRYDPKRVPENLFRRRAVPTSARYRLATGLAVDLQEAHKAQQDRLAQIKEQMSAAEEEIKEIRHRSPQSFLESVLASNQLSEKDLETHGKLQAAALRWLYDQGFVATAELVVGARRWDVVGCDENGRVTIVEAKASISDFRRDDKWREYLPYADRFYFVVEERFRDIHGTPAEEAGWLVMSHAGQIRVDQACSLHLEAQDRDATRWAISPALSKRIIFGF